MNPYDIYKNPVGKIYADATGLDIMPAIITAVEATEKPDVPHYFYFEAVEAGSTFQINAIYSECTYEYSTDEENWTNLGYKIITLAKVGDRAYIRQSSDEGYWSATSSSSYRFNTTGNLRIGGCISTLAYKDLSHDSPGSGMEHIFYNCTAITDASDLKLDFVELTSYCYRSMFSGCTSLTTAPKLLATKLAFNCYQTMFGGCRSLTIAPELPATELAGSCYSSMFSGCTSLTTAPELPATELAERCYWNMFYNCSSLTTAPELPAPELAKYCYSQMFYGCTSLTTAPELPAPELAYYCYQGMFSGCTNLNSITVHATSWNTSYAENWVQNVSPTGTFYKLISFLIPTGTSGVPSGWTKVFI